MNAKQPSQPYATGDVIRDAIVAGTILPAASLPGFRDGSRLAFRDEQHADQPDQSGQSKHLPGRVHAAFTGLLALGTIAILALGR